MTRKYGRTQRHNHFKIAGNGLDLVNQDLGRAVFIALLEGPTGKVKAKYAPRTPMLASTVLERVMAKGGYPLTARYSVLRYPAVGSVHIYEVAQDTGREEVLYVRITENVLATIMKEGGHGTT